MLTVAAILTRMLVSESCGWWLGNGLFLVAKSSCFGCGIAFFWLRNRFLVAESVPFWLRKSLFLVAEACLILVAESPKFGCGSVEIWFRNRNLFLGFCHPHGALLAAGKILTCHKVERQHRLPAMHRERDWDHNRRPLSRNRRPSAYFIFLDLCYAMVCPKLAN